MLEQQGWRGIAIEPIPAIFRQLQQNRRCHCVNACVTATEGEAEFIELEGVHMLSTLATHNVGLTARRLRKNAKRHGGALKQITVQCRRLDSLLTEHGYTHIDFLSLDTEGGELDILKSIDFTKTPVRAISVENNYYTSAIKNHLTRQGFIYLGTFKIDELYLYGGDSMRATRTAHP